LTPETFAELFKAHIESGAKVTLGTSILSDPKGYGRILRDETGAPVRIVEDKDASDAERAIREINVGLYCFDSQTLFRILPTLSNANAQGEYYLTDVLEAVRNEGGKLAAKVFDDPRVTVGVNDRWQLALAEGEMRREILRKHAVSGVTLRSLDSIVIDVDVSIGTDSVIEPGTILLGKTSIGEGCIIGPNSRIGDTSVGAGTTIVSSYLDSAEIGKGVWIGPFAHLRPHSQIGDGAKVGNYVEIKNAQIGEGAKVNHLSYVGDASVGENANIGAGTITCNYNGFAKHRTHIGANAFVGSNSTLVAPVTIGQGSIVAAGSVITHDVPDEAGAFGRARQENKEGWAARWRKKKKSTE